MNPPLEAIYSERLGNASFKCVLWISTPLRVANDEEKLGATHRSDKVLELFDNARALQLSDVIVAVSEETAFRNFPTTEPRGLVGRESYWF